jgi:hypothetical protein
MTVETGALICNPVEPDQVRTSIKKTLSARVQFFTPHPDSLVTMMVAREHARRWTPGRWLWWSRLPDPDARWRWFPDLEGERRWGPCVGKRQRPRRPEAAALSRPVSQGPPPPRPDVRVETAPHEARGSSGVTKGTRCAQRQSRVTSSDPTQFGRPK